MEARSISAVMMCTAVTSSPSPPRPVNSASASKSYDYLLKFLLVGDSDVGKEELLSGMEDGATESPYGYSNCGVYSFIVLLTISCKHVNMTSSNDECFHF